MPEEKSLSLPGSSWETIKKIVRAFYAAQNEENPRVEDIANLADVPRPVVSLNNNFLRSVGLVRQDQWKLTEMGVRYATALQMNNASMAQETLGEIARSNSLIGQLLRLLTARGHMKADTFKAEALLRLTIGPNERQAQFVKPVFDMLVDGGLIEMDGDTVSLANVAESSTKREIQPITLQSIMPPQLSPKTPPAEELPILLAPNRIAYLRLPDDWDGKKDLGKLLKLLELSLGDVS